MGAWEKGAAEDSVRGLTEREAAKRLDRVGPNEFSKGKRLNPWGIFVSQFKDVLTLILVVSTFLSIFMGEFTEAIAILIIILLNSIMGFIQEFRTEKTLDALKNLAAPAAHVIRGGELRNIPASQIVPGDLVVLEPGDRVPSDARVVQSTDLQVDESLLTGESVPVEKAAEGSERVYMGTMVTKGRGRVMTYATGMRTEMGKIAGMLTQIGDEQTPLQKRLAELGKYIAIGCLAVCAVVSVTGILRGEPIFNMIVTGISLAVAAVPEGLPAIVTISLALGVNRMLARNALVRRLTAVETLGCATVICSDKTGTLTENKMTVRRIYTLQNELDVTGGGFSDEGDFLCAGRKVKPVFMEDVRLALEIGALCNNAEVMRRTQHGLFHSRAEVEISGDPTEAALLIAAQKAGISMGELSRKYERTEELPFDSDRKCMSIAVTLKSGGRRLFTKGAPDIILDKCGYLHTKSGPVLLTDAVRAAILRANDRMADGALRVLAVAYREIPSGTGQSLAELERNLVFVGLQGMIDPPRKEAVAAVHKCVRAGIRPVMITGDHKRTAAAIAREIGILHDGDSVFTGAELDRMSDAQLMKEVPKASVFARVSPSHKMRIVKSYKRCGNVVAMTGDGVNDAPAVKEADIGVSMGLTGTDVTKEASSMILLDDNFASLVAAVEEGRVIYRNIRKFIRYLISCNIGEVLTMFIGMLIGLPVVLQPIQILWVNLVTDGLPAIALSLEPPDEDVMDCRPRGVHESIFSGGLTGMMLFRGCLIGLCTLGSFISIFKFTGNVDSARTAALMTLVFVQLVHVFECKSEKSNLLHIHIFNNPMLILACAASVIMTLVVVYVPSLRAVFGTMPLGIPELLRVAGYILAGPLLALIVYRDKKGPRGYTRRRAG